MMGKQVVIIGIVLSFLLGCDQTPEIVGTWKVDDGFYKATYKIEEKNEKIKAEVLAYNDGTTIYVKDDEAHYIFQDLKKKGDCYVEVDGISGATLNSDTSHTTKLKLINDSTLEVMQYIMERPVIEIWYKQKIND